MKVRIISLIGYRDRYGADYRQGEIASLPIPVAKKLIRHNIAAPLGSSSSSRATKGAKNEEG